MFSEPDLQSCSCFCAVNGFQITTRWETPAGGRDVLTWSPPGNLTVSSALGKMNFSPFMCVHTSFALSLFAWISNSSTLSNSSMSATKVSPFQIPTACNAYPRNIPGKTFGPNWCSRDKSSAEIGWYSTIAPKGITGSVEWMVGGFHGMFLLSAKHSRSLVRWEDTLRKTVRNAIVQAWLQQYCRGTFFHSAPCSLSNPICFWSVRCWRTMIPGKVCTRCAKF